MSAHPDGEVLTAFVDGRLADDDERDAVEQHVVACDECARSIAEERHLVVALRSLEFPGAPAEFYARVLARGPVSVSRTRRATRFAVANAAAAAAVWAGVVGIAHVTGGQTVRPAFASLRSAAHGGASTQASGVELRPTWLGAGVPATLDDSYTLVEHNVHSGRRQAFYVDAEGSVVSLFVQSGDLDAASLPADAETVPVDGASAWRFWMGDDLVVVVQRPGAVITLVGMTSEHTSAVASEAAGRPPRPSVRERVHAAAQGLLETFGLG